MKYRNFITLAILGLAAAAVYLVYIDRIGYQNDDWYLMYAARTYGTDVFTNIYRIDRPARALVFIPAYHLFGSNVLYYNVSALLFRLAAAWCFGWILQQLWKSASSANFLAALLFFIYPGFLSQFNGIDYQAQMVSLAAAMASIAMSIKSQFEPKWIKKILWLLPAIVLGWFYLGLVEYFIGFELFRLMVFLIFKARETRPFGERLQAAFRSWLPNFLIPSVFLWWRVFVFESERGATDIGRQISGVIDAPLVTTVSWLVRLFLNSVDVTFSAWVIPLYQLSAELTRLREIAFVLLASVVLLTSSLWWIRRLDETDRQKLERSTWQNEALILGAVIVVAGLFPVIVVNRAVDFTDFSRYALASSAGSALILTTLLFLLPSVRLRALGISLLLVVAAFTQHAKALKTAKEAASLQKFWWQVAWRVPLIKAGCFLF